MPRKANMKNTKKHILNKKTRFILLVSVCVLIILSLTSIKIMDANGITFEAIIDNVQKFVGLTENEYITEARQKFNFNYDWKFSKGVGKNNAGSDLAAENVTVIPTTDRPYENAYNTASWENVSLPHTYNDVDTFNNYMESGQNGERSMYSGTAWYKKQFYIPQEYEGKKIYIEFEAARQAADIYINGTKIEGKCENGFIPFGYDITSSLDYGANNTITVMVDNSFPYYVNGNAIPWHDSHWHPNYGGLYRNSYMYVVDPVHLTLPLYSFLESEGTYVYTSNETAATADVNIEAEIENSTGNSKQVKLMAYVKKADETIACQMESNEITLEAASKNSYKLTGTVENAIRWSTTYPYLYTVECKIIDIATNTVIDNNETKLGIRTYKFTNDYGMFLNGTYEKLTGWGQKPTNEWAGLGAAYPDWMQDYTIKLMKNAGSNFIRWGHSAGSPTQLESADKYGIITMQPGVDGEGNYASTYSTATYKLRTDAFRDMIIYYRNNPSILIWEIGNQTMPTSVAATIVSYIQRYDHGNRSYVTENAEGNYEFNTTENIQNCGSNASTIFTSTRLAGVRLGDLTMKDYVSIGITTQGGGGMDSSVKGNKPRVEGEFNRLEARRGVWDFYTTGYANFKNETTADSEYEYVTSEEFAASQAKKYVSMIGSSGHSGGANWIFSDSISHGRLTSEVARASGEVDAVMLPKEAYWATSVIYSKTSSAYLIGHWNYTAGTIKNVYAVAKASGIVTATLTVTKASDGTTATYEGTKTNDFLWTFTNVGWQAGSARVDFKRSNGTTIVSCTKSSHGTPASLEITAKNGPGGLLANGSDVLLLDVEVLDSDGNRCNTFDGVRDNIKVDFTVNSQTANETRDNYCVWRGGYNSSIENSTNKKDLYIESGITRVALRTTMNPGQISVTATVTLPGGVVITDTYTTTSVAVNNTNGYSSQMNLTPLYNLVSLTPTVVGDGSLPETDESGMELDYVSNLVDSVNYTGNTEISYEINSTLENGALMYIDTSETFTSIPYKYLNAEYLRVPSTDNGEMSADLITFVPIKDVTIIVMADPSVLIPEWLASYTKTTDIATGSNNVVYDIYTKEVPAGEGVTLGANSISIAEGQKGKMYISAVKATYQVQQDIFFEEKFGMLEDTATLRGWTAKTTGGNVTMLGENFDGVQTAHLLDNNTNAMGYLYKRFATINNKVKVSFRSYVNSTLEGQNIANKFIRVWLHNGPAFEDPLIRTNAVVETYFMDNTSLIYRTKAGGNTDYTITNSISSNNWHEYEYAIDIPNNKLSVKVDNVQKATDQPLFSTDHTEIDHIIFGTGNSSLNNVYFDTLKIEPISENILTGIRVDGKHVANFHPMTKDYLCEVNIGQPKVVTLEHGADYETAYIDYELGGRYADIVATSTSGIAETHRVYFRETLINKTKLRCVLSEAEHLEEECYTQATWDLLQTAVANGEVVLADVNAIGTEVIEIVNDIRNKIHALELDTATIRSTYFP